MKHGGEKEGIRAEQCRAKLELSAVKQHFLFPAGIQVHPASSHVLAKYDLISAGQVKTLRQYIILSWLLLHRCKIIASTIVDIVDSGCTYRFYSNAEVTN